jgi:hypothetical protein
MAQSQLFDTRGDISESAFQKTIMKGLTREGWTWTHVRAMRTPDGRWLTGTSSPGFPDLLAVCPGFVLGLELKARRKYPKPEQKVWLEALLEAGALAWVLRPSDDWGDIALWLHDPSQAPRKYGW